MAAAVAKPRDDEDVLLPPGPPEVALPPAPQLEGPLSNVTIKTLIASIEWLYDSVQAFSANSSEVTLHIANHSKRISALEVGLNSQRATVRRLIERLEEIEKHPLEGMATRLANCEQSLSTATSKLDHLQLDVETTMSSQDRMRKDMEEDFESLKSRSTKTEAALHDLTDRVGVTESRIADLEGREPMVVTGEKPPPRVYDPFVLRRPLGVSREFLDLKNQRGIQNLGQEQADLKISMEDFQELVKDEVMNLGTQITDVSADLDKMLVKHKEELQSKLEELEGLRASDEAAREVRTKLNFTDMHGEVTKLQSTLNTLSKEMKEVQHAGRVTTSVLAVADAKQQERGRSPEAAGPTKVLDVRGDVSLQRLGQVDVLDELRRLRAVVESVQSVLPVDMQQRIEFFKQRVDTSPQGRAPSPPNDSEWTAILGASADHHKGERAEILVQEQHRSTSAFMRKCERDVSRLDAKVEDLWTRLPKIAELVQPVQERLFKGEMDAASVNKISGRSQLPVLVSMAQEAWNTSFHAFKGELQSDIRRLRSDLESTINSKASAGDVAALSSKLDAWTTTQGPGGWTKVPGGHHKKGDPERSGTPVQDRERMRATQSLGRLPQVSANSFAKQGSAMPE
mmetsp:Transcript_31288/g.72972  ORF Transcript_31288/g.72972 Transcript_31288/m.72972 type:complete len:626 (+) Transcript_31288:45-1922(+)